MKYDPKLYVGFQRSRYSNSENPRILGFAVPYNDTKSSKKRQKTVDRWREKDIEPKIIDNVPIRGFKFLEVVGRYSTSNKLFRLQDPRGFELEISSDNALNIALNTTIVKGEIVDECVWMGKSLMLASSKEYQIATGKIGTKAVNIEVGKLYQNPDNSLSVFQYNGIFHHTYISQSAVVDKFDVEPGSNSYYKRDTRVITEVTQKTQIFMNSGKKPSYIYTEYSLNEDGYVTRARIHVRKSHFKGLIEFDGKLQEHDFNLRDILNNGKLDEYWKSTKTDDDIPYSLTTNLSGSKHRFFDTKEEAKSYDYETQISEEGLSDRCYPTFNSDGLRSYYNSYYSQRRSPDMKVNQVFIDKR